VKGDIPINEIREQIDYLTNYYLKVAVEMVWFVKEGNDRNQVCVASSTAALTVAVARTTLCEKEIEVAVNNIQFL
jgi:hypothetical protein